MNFWARSGCVGCAVYYHMVVLCLGPVILSRHSEVVSTVRTGLGLVNV